MVVNSNIAISIEKIVIIDDVVPIKIIRVYLGFNWDFYEVVFMILNVTTDINVKNWWSKIFCVW